VPGEAQRTRHAPGLEPHPATAMPLLPQGACAFGRDLADAGPGSGGPGWKTRKKYLLIACTDLLIDLRVAGAVTVP
jgi:hypothetical protein